MFKKKRHSVPILPNFYFIDHYDERIKELIEESEEQQSPDLQEHKNGLRDVYSKMSSVEARSCTSIDSAEVPDMDRGMYRRNSESSVFIGTVKNQPLCKMYPMDGETIVCYTDIDLVSCNLKSNTNNEYKGQGDLILTTHRLSVLHKKRLKHSNFLKHLSCRLCQNQAIPNSDSCLQLVSPLGDDFYIRFRSPSDCSRYLKEIDNYIQQKVSETKLEDIELQVFQDTQTSNEPLISKKFNCSITTTCQQLKEVAFKEFGITDLNLADVCIRVKISQGARHLPVNDNVRLMMLLDHLKLNNESPDCNSNCQDNSNIPQHFKFYLKNIASSSGEAVKSKKTKKLKTTNEFLYNLNKRWLKDEELPSWLMNLMSDLYENGGKTEGVFRTNGLASKIELFMQNIARSDDLVVEENINTKAGILKKFLSTIEGTLLNIETNAEYESWCAYFTDRDRFYADADLRIQFVEQVKALPVRNQLLLGHLLVLLQHITHQNEITKMTASSIGTCIGQSLFGKYSALDIGGALRRNYVVEALLSQHDQLLDDEAQRTIICGFKQLSRDDLLRTSMDSISSANSRTVLDSSTEDKSRLSDSERPVVPQRLKRSNNLGRIDPVSVADVKRASYNPSRSQCHSPAATAGESPRPCTFEDAVDSLQQQSRKTKDSPDKDAAPAVYKPFQRNQIIKPRNRTRPSGHHSCLYKTSSVDTESEDILQDSCICGAAAAITSDDDLDKESVASVAAAVAAAASDVDEDEGSPSQHQQQVTTAANSEQNRPKEDAQEHRVKLRPEEPSQRVVTKASPTTGSTVIITKVRRGYSLSSVPGLTPDVRKVISKFEDIAPSASPASPGVAPAVLEGVTSVKKLITRFNPTPPLRNQQGRLMRQQRPYTENFGDMGGSGNNDDTSVSSPLDCKDIKEAIERDSDVTYI